MLRVDVVVIGGGPAGTATAIALCRAGRGVLIVERSRYGEWRAGETLPPSAAPLLEALGLTDRLRAGCATPCRTVRSAWGSNNLTHRDFILGTHGSGWHLDRRRFDAALADAAEAEGATVWRGAHVTSIDRTSVGWQIRLSVDGGALGVEASFLVDATGRGNVARMQGARWLSYDRLVGIVASVRGDASQELLVEAIPDGWWYSVPQPDGSLLAALMVDHDSLDRHAAARWHEGLVASSHTAARVRGSPSEIRVRRAMTGRLASPVGSGWAAVGDAASAYDPLAGRGLTKALETGLLAGTAVHAELCGSVVALERYATAVANSFQRHLRERGEHYRGEWRWRDRTFWRRRHPIDPQRMRLTLDPARRLRPHRPSSDHWAPVEGWLALEELQRLRALTDHHDTAADAIAAFLRTSPVRIPDRWAIVALQLLSES